jgi:hypothetical protein
VEGTDVRDVDALLADIERLVDASRVRRDTATDRDILRLRHLAGVALTEQPASAAPAYVAPSSDELPPTLGLDGLPASSVTAPRLRAAILRDGYLIVRGLVPHDTAVEFAGLIERAGEARAHRADAEGYYEEFATDPRYAPLVRKWIRSSGGLLAVDSPAVAFQMIELLTAAGLPKLATEYLGERVAWSAHKTTLRKVEPDTSGAWHQDGSFMGRVRSLNVWLSLSRCGEDAPGLDIVGRRLDDLVPTGTPGTFLADQVSQAVAEEAAGVAGIVRPRFEPGDAVLFDELCLHKTSSDPAFTEPRFALESWIFGCSTVPGSYAPMAL